MGKSSAKKETTIESDGGNFLLLIGGIRGGEANIIAAISIQRVTSWYFPSEGNLGRYQMINEVATTHC